MKAILTVTALSVLLACPVRGSDLPDLGEVSDTALSLSEEARIGRNAMRQLRDENAVLDDTEAASYLAGLGRRLAGGSGQRFTFFVVNDAGINAFAMPGGYIGVNAGLILTTQAEGELASVMGHEMAHVTQRHMARMQASRAGNQLLLLATLVAATLAARSGNSDATFGALNAGMGLGVASQLSFSRDFEREADRVGMQYLAQAGFDVRDMPAFFQRMQQANRLTDNKALSFLQTHPVTSERISEAQNRAEGQPVRMRADSTGYLLVREKLRVLVSEPDAALSWYDTALASGHVLNAGAAWYGLARARLANRDTAGAAKALAEARSRLSDDPMLHVLDAEIAAARKDWPRALVLYRAGLARYPSDRALIEGELGALFESGDLVTAATRLRQRLDADPSDPVLYRLQARLFADKDPLRYHAALGNAMYFEQRPAAALEQFHLASAARGEDFYLRSSIEARARELEKMLKDEKNAERN